MRAPIPRVERLLKVGGTCNKCAGNSFQDVCLADHDKHIPYMITQRYAPALNHKIVMDVCLNEHERTCHLRNHEFKWHN